MSDTSPSELDILATRLNAVEAAMARLDAGTYGLCEGCGEALSADAIDADVTVSLCTTCVATRNDG